MNFSFKDFLALEVSPALGCTEPVAVALAAAAAAGLLPTRSPEHIRVRVDGNVFKNGLAVIIPGTDGRRGLDLAAALGAVAGDAGRAMQVLEGLSPQQVEQAADLVGSNRVEVDLDPDQHGLFIQAEITAGQDMARALIQGAHDSIVNLSLNGRKISDSPLLEREQDVNSSPLHHHSVGHLEAWLKEQSLSSLLALLQQADDQDLAFLRQGVDMNRKLAEYGLAHASGLGVGQALAGLAEEKILNKDMLLAAKILTAAAADARMAGVSLPAMSSAGSGNNGLTAILPIWAAGEFLDCPEKTLLQAIGLSHLVTAYIKTHTGRLSAVCSCSLAAGAGSAAGLAYALGGDVQCITRAVNNVIEDLGGVLCDGAKTGCALKLATAAGSAIQAALLAQRGVGAVPVEGILGQSPEQSIANLGRICQEGMTQTGATILDIMLGKRSL
ncbi:MAG: L-serine ammonia-lyase, iron-sulfur-dependent, subunit alpha [Desulfovermiculus sp.]|nr:L-serine ammonia-lyase, iron-sulfur-dependent, subunit alpha [Desulfovermiculus sp.]